MAVYTRRTLSPEEVITSNGSNKIIPASSTLTQQGSYKTMFGTFSGEIKWVNVVVLAILHVLSVWSLAVFPYLEKFPLFLYAFTFGNLGALGITAGVHRLWTHRSYKAKLPLRIFLMLCFSSAAQNSLYEWVRDHRLHHNHSETDADPHNAKRGFFFSHVGWLMLKKNSEVLRRGKEIDMTDVMADPVVQFHQKHFILLKILFGFVLPTIIPPLMWRQDWYWTILAICFGRYGLSLHITWSVNSAAHLWGKKPYQKNIYPSENITVSIITMGEGWHNYHHTFPWDYKAAELGNYVNLTTFWINVFAKIGWAYDLKQPSIELVKQVAKKHGDGSHPVWGNIEIPESAELEIRKQIKQIGTKL